MPMSLYSESDANPDCYKPALEKAASYLEEILQVMRADDPDGCTSLEIPVPSAGSIPLHCESGRSVKSSASSTNLTIERAVAHRSAHIDGCLNDLSFLSAETQRKGSCTDETTAEEALLTLDSDISFHEEGPLEFDKSPWAATVKVPALKGLPLAGRDSNSDLVAGSQCFIGLVRELIGVLRDERLPESKLRQFQEHLAKVLRTLSRMSAVLDLDDGAVNVAERLQDIVERELDADELAWTKSSLRQHKEELLQFKDKLQQYETERAELLSHLDNLRMELRRKDTELAQLRAQVHSVADHHKSGFIVDDLAGTGAQPCIGDTYHAAFSDALAQARTRLRCCEKDLVESRCEAEERMQALQKLELRVQRNMDDYAHFIKQLTSSPTAAVMPKMLDLRTAEILSIGNYGYLFLCQDRGCRDRVAIKVQSQRWLDDVVREWAHVSDVGPSPHFVAYRQLVMHRDSDREIVRCLESGFAAGTLQGRRPSLFPESYVCILFEYMDQGTLQDLIDTQLMTPEGVAAVARQVAKALAFMHGKQRTHNDIRPVNVMLKRLPAGGDCLAVKLADCGLACRSVERRQDCDLLGYLIWCTGLDRSFQRCPGPEDQASALDEFAAAAPETHGIQLWAKLLETVRGLWHGFLTMVDIEGMEVFKDCEVRVSHAAAAHLEQRAKGALLQRTSISWERAKEGWLQQRRKPGS